MSLDLENIRAIFSRDKREIVKKYGGTGTGIGKSGDDYIIVIYTDDPKKKTDEPLFWENIPVKIEYTGKFTIQK